MRRGGQEITRPDHPGPLEWAGWIIRPSDDKHEDIYKAPNEPGIYAWYSLEGDLMYVGRSVAIATRLRQHMKRTNFGVEPSLYSYRLIPEEYVAGVEVAHIDTLRPAENRYRDAFSTPFQEPLRAAIEAAWADTLPAQRERLDAVYTAMATRIAEQIAARI